MNLVSLLMKTGWNRGFRPLGLPYGHNPNLLLERHVHPTEMYNLQEQMFGQMQFVNLFE
jgi:hypothetical protein